MVSQPTMRSFLGSHTCLLGLTAALLLCATCGQNDGGRCQVNSDCGSGLTCCNGSTGNGLCHVSCFAPDDASVASSGTKDDALSSTLDSASDPVPMSSSDSAIDGASAIDSADIEAGGEAGGID